MVAPQPFLHNHELTLQARLKVIAIRGDAGGMLFLADFLRAQAVTDDVTAGVAAAFRNEAPDPFGEGAGHRDDDPDGRGRLFQRSGSFILPAPAGGPTTHYGSNPSFAI